MPQNKRLSSIEVQLRIIAGDLIAMRKWLLPEQADLTNEAVKLLQKAIELETGDTNANCRDQDQR
jgi:hypothetical protein